MQDHNGWRDRLLNVRAIFQEMNATLHKYNSLLPKGSDYSKSIDTPNSYLWPELCNCDLYHPFVILGEMLGTGDDSCFPLVGRWGYGFHHTSLRTGGGGKQELNKGQNATLEALKIRFTIVTMWKQASTWREVCFTKTASTLIPTMDKGSHILGKKKYVQYTKVKDTWKKLSLHGIDWTSTYELHCYFNSNLFLVDLLASSDREQRKEDIMFQRKDRLI